MSDDDPVLLTVVTPRNYVRTQILRRVANDVMQDWYYRRTRNWFRRFVNRIRSGWEKETLAANYAAPSGEGVYAGMVVGYEFVIGMYISEVAPTPQDRLAVAQAEYFRQAKEDHKKMHEGDDWKGGSGGDE